MIRRFSLLAATLLVSGLAWNVHVEASVTRALSLAELVAESDHISVARVIRQEARWQGRRIVTDVTLEIETSMKGGAAGEQIVLRRLGGAIGDLGMRVEGEPGFTDGERSVIFARNARGALRPVGMSQGVLPVRVQAGAEMVLPGGAGLALVRATPDNRFLPAPAALVSPRPLAEVLDEIRAALAETRGR